jgi:hypothetical protein
MNDAPITPTAKSVSKWTTGLVFTAVLLIIAGLVIGQEQINPFASMLSITIGCLFAIIAAVIVCIKLIRQRSLGNVYVTEAIALILGVAALYSAAGMMGGGAAPIHDISTNTQNPPAFVDIVALRSDSDNTTDYLDDGTAEAQAAAYPDIQTIVLETTFESSFAAALAASHEMGWEVVASKPTEGRIEAIATTSIVGFKDDVVIRVTEQDGKTLVDVRSKSRIGKGDMGVNANRIRAYTEQLAGS